MPATPADAATKRRKARDTYLQRTYGIDLVKYEEMLDAQGGRCAICLCRPRTRNLAVDHDHFSGVVRGLLCGRCNHGLLQFAQEDITILKRAIEYLLSYLEGNRNGPDSLDQITYRPGSRGHVTPGTPDSDESGSPSLAVSEP